MKILSLLIITMILSTGLNGQGWVRQNPAARFARLNDVDFDGLHGLTVGNDGVLFTTHDGGNTWEPQQTPDADENLHVAFVLPGSNGQIMLAGGDSLLLLSMNGGNDWYINFDDIQGIYKIEVMPNGEWMVLGSTYRAVSSDQGGFWQPYNNPGLDATAGHFTSILTGWVSSGGFNNEQVWYTSNGGFNWELRDQIKFTTITRLTMVNNLIGYLTSGSQIYKTINGGDIWFSENANPTGSITDIHVITQNEVWTSLDNGNVFYSLTGGNSWIEKFPDLISNNSALGIYADLNGNVYMPGKFVSISHSDDYGVTWRDQIPGSKANLFQPHFNNELIGIVGGSDGTLMLTINGGDYWGVVQFPKDDNFFAASMIDNQAMVIGSSRGRVYLSENLGVSWDTIGTGLGQITDIEAFDHQTFIICTEDGRIYRTIDRGFQWNKEYDNGGIPLFALDFVNHQKGWACGYQGEIIATTNNGDDWAVQPTPGKGSFSEITFTNELEGGNPFIEAWFDKRDIPPGSEWNDKVPQAIQNCKCLLFALTKDSVTKESICGNELDLALRYKKPILIIRLQKDVEPPFRLGEVQWIDFLENRKAGLAKLRLAIQRVDSPEGQLDALKSRLSAATRDLSNAKSEEEKQRIQLDVDELNKQIETQQRIVDNPQAAQEQTQKNIEAGLERERQPEKPVASKTSTKFINPPPGLAPNYFQDRNVETKQVFDFLNEDSQRLMQLVFR